MVKLTNSLKLHLSKCQVAEVGGGGALVVFDQNHGRFISGVLLPGLWNLISRIFKLAAGSFIYCRRKDFFKIGGFSEKLYAGEEIDFCITLKRLLRKTGLAFTIISKAPVVTSSRKLLWYKDHKIFFVLLSLLIFPFAVRSRRLLQFLVPQTYLMVIKFIFRMGTSTPPSLSHLIHRFEYR